MLTIRTDGARALLALLQRIREGHDPDDAEIDAALQVDPFFAGFYGGWDPDAPNKIGGAIRHFDRPDRAPRGLLPERLAEGFGMAVDQAPLMAARLAWLEEVDTSALAGRVLAYLPPSTPLDATIHITIDLFNNAFVHGNAMGVSVLHGATEQSTFESVVSHELHHLGFGYWSGQDAARQALLHGSTGRAVAVAHVQNLLLEGMANYYLTPQYVFLEMAAEGLPERVVARLQRLGREERELMARAEAILAACLEPGAETEACWEAYRALAMDMEEAVLPAGHYLGARMIRTMEAAHPGEEIVACVRDLRRFLPLYNAAARDAGAFVFDEGLVQRFACLWAEV